jgi:hypothetical protein
MTMTSHCPSETADPNVADWPAAEQHVLRFLKRIRTAHEVGDRRKANHLIQEYLRSRDAKLIAVRDAWKRLKPHRRPAAELIPSIASGLDAWRGTNEPVIFWPRAKTSNPQEFRIILDFGIENRALQYLVKPVLKARADLHPNQYLLKGTHAAIAEVAKLMAQGYVWAVETDIRNCYPSFDGEKVGGLLPIPKRVTQSTVLGASLSLKAHKEWADCFGEVDEEYVSSTYTELADARRGFPQGSAASPLAVEMLLAPVFAQLPPAGASIGYADNFLAMATNEDDAVSMTLAFWSALRAHPAGQLSPKPPKVSAPGDHVDFLGHRLRNSLGSILIEPSPENLNKFEFHMHIAIGKIQAEKSDHARIRRTQNLRRFVRSWTGSFAACTDILSFRDKAFLRIQHAI